MSSMRKTLAVPAGPVRLADHDPSARPLLRKKDDVPKTRAKQLADLQERLWAESKAGAQRRVLLVLQGMDTAGKGGVTEHVVGICGPIGVQYTGFKKPTPQELTHHFLWRIRRHVPGPGVIGVFDRSHYEDVLVVRVHDLVPPEVWGKRYAEINRFEAQLAAQGVTIVKCFLHISKKEQRKRLLSRLAHKNKHWKFNEGDIDERGFWDSYMAAYEAALEQCNTEVAPWYIVPSDDKEYRNWAVSEILRETLRDLDLHYPRPDLDLQRLRKRLAPGR